MAHFARIDESNTVTQVVVVSNEIAVDEATGVAFLNDLYGTQGGWLQCSYNNNTRKQFPGIGYTYDALADVFIAPRPYPSCSLDQNHDWQPPVPRPEEGRWRWDEDTHTWIQA